MKRYKRTKKFHKMMLRYIVSQLDTVDDEGHNRRVEEEFKHIDKSLHGAITKEEFLLEFETTLSKEHLDPLFDALDLSKNGLITLLDWKAAMTFRLSGGLSEPKLDMTFDFFDKDRCGVLHLQDI